VIAIMSYRMTLHAAEARCVNSGEPAHKLTRPAHGGNE
jgi:hypothetical protein